MHINNVIDTFFTLFIVFLFTANIQNFLRNIQKRFKLTKKLPPTQQKEEQRHIKISDEINKKSNNTNIKKPTEQTEFFHDEVQEYSNQ